MKAIKKEICLIEILDEEGDVHKEIWTLREKEIPYKIEGIEFRYGPFGTGPFEHHKIRADGETHYLPISDGVLTLEEKIPAPSGNGIWTPEEFDKEKERR